jgi:hypothetical protein
MSRKAVKGEGESSSSRHDEERGTEFGKWAGRKKHGRKKHGRKMKGRE